MLNDISRTDREHLINEWIFNERDRSILKRRLIDGMTYDLLSEEFELSYDRVKQICKRGEVTILYRYNPHKTTE